MVLKNATWLTVFSLITATSIAQQGQNVIPQRNCGSAQYYEWLMQNDPAFAQKQQDIEQSTQDYINSQAAMKIGDQQQFQQILTVPVVFHVVYNTASQNISDTRLNEQLDILNKDFSATNTDINNVPSAFQSFVGTPTIQFCLAKVDPSGNTTTGIIRKSTSTTSFGINDAVKKSSTGGDDIWDRTKYLNIWICNLSGGVLGYSPLPGSAALTDGVVLHYQFVGTTGVSAPYNLGRTGTHEIGHWFNLRHIWGDANCGNDLVSDTPTQQSPNSGCPSFPKVSCSNGANGEMFMNFMDYVDDPCMVMFSKGQVARMSATFATTSSPRYSLFNSTKCGTTALTVDAGVSAIISPSGTLCDPTILPSVTLKNFGTATLTSVKINYQKDASTAVAYNWSGSLAAGASTTVNLPSYTSTVGNHSYTATTSNPNNTTDNNTANDGSTISFIVRTSLTLPFSEGFESTTFPPTGWSINNPDVNSTWIKNTSAKKSGSASATVQNYTYNSPGQRDELVTPDLNLSSVPNPTLSFWVAYTYYTNPYQASDTLEVLISTDCGKTLNSIYKSWGNNLATAPYKTTSFVPTATQWKKINVPLTGYTSSTKASLYFRNGNSAENNMYIDDINVDYALGINETSLEGISIYPNPSKGDIYINLGNIVKGNNTIISGYNMLGETIFSEQISANTNTHKIDMNTFTSGMYVIEVITNNNRLTKRVMIDK